MICISIFWLFQLLTIAIVVSLYLLIRWHEQHNYRKRMAAFSKPIINNSIDLKNVNNNSVLDGERYIQFWKYILCDYRTTSRTKPEENGVNSELKSAYNQCIKGNTYNAIMEFKRLLESEIGKNDIFTKCLGLSGIGFAYFLRGNLHTALEFHNKVNEIYNELKFIYGQADELLNTAHIYINVSDKSNSIQCLRKAATILTSVDHKIAEAKIPQIWGIINDAEGNWDDAFQYHTISLQLFQAIHVNLEVGNQFCNLGKVYLRQGRYENAEENFDSALEIFRKVGYRYGAANVLKNKGEIYYDKGQYDEALSYYNKALIIFKDTGHMRAEADLYINIGRIHGDLNNPQLAAANYSDSNRIYSELGYQKGQADTLINMARLQIDYGDYDLAKDNLRIAYRYFKQLNLDKDVAICTFFQGYILFKTEEFKAALRLLRKSPRF